MNKTSDSSMFNHSLHKEKLISIFQKEAQGLLKRLITVAPIFKYRDNGGTTISFVHIYQEELKNFMTKHYNVAVFVHK